MKKTQCFIKITDFMDSKSFPQLMKKHKIKILEQKDGRNEITFTVQGSESDLEDIMVYTSLRWQFV
jgi:hypothetical protein